MPTPGSRAYDTQRARHRKDAENSKDAENNGINDQKANAAAKEELQEAGYSRGTDPAKDADRARGPKGER